MTIIRILFLGIIIGFITLVISQNLDFFASRTSVGINLRFWQYRTPEILNGIISVSFFIVGFLASYLMNAAERFRSAKSIRTLNRACDAQTEEIGILKGRLNALQKGASQELKPKSPNS